MSYLALARKYRPRMLSELVGQDFLVQTLRNAISSKKIHHAFLFTGTRGVGKTTTARILALSLNCIGNDGNSCETITPCLECIHCRDIINGSHADVIEIDAASNTGVSSIREIIDSARYSPMSARYKIYIIDEVHMLSKAAFNALLKTLEEPISSTKFIFATTEFHKVPITIVSRCQKFFLNNVKNDIISSHLCKILDKENIVYEKNAVDAISDLANGSVRDSLSILDQAINISDANVSIQTIDKMLFLGDRKMISDMFVAIIENRSPDAISFLKSSINIGIDSNIILGDLLKIINIILKIKSEIEVGTLSISDKIYNIMCKDIKEKVSNDLLNRFWNIIIETMSQMKIMDSVTTLEMMIFKMCFISTLPSPSQVIATLSDDILLKSFKKN
jgi:DNA polymerase-3 subunit gamma/tau